MYQNAPLLAAFPPIDDAINRSGRAVLDRLPAGLYRKGMILGPNEV
jgi:hypothetical protein